MSHATLRLLPFSGGTSTLYEHGVEILPFIANEKLDALAEEFRKMEDEFPEFAPDARCQLNVQPLVLGAFAAYGNPSSFHNSFVKTRRHEATKAVITNGIFKRFLEDPRIRLPPSSYKLEVLFDRVMHRHPHQETTPETAHRDVTPREQLSAGDFVFGGWVNLSKHDQFFTCQPGSHLHVANTTEASAFGEGFNKLTPEARQQYVPHRRKFTVPPGSIIIFVQHILHEVFKSSDDHEQMRLFMGWRLTTGGRLLFAEKKRRAIDMLGVPLLPSGQKPVMYGSNHGSVYLNKPFRWCAGRENNGTTIDWLRKSFAEQVKERNFGKKVAFHNRAMDSLREYGFDATKYEYEAPDRALMLSLHDIDTQKLSLR